MKEEDRLRLLTLSVSRNGSGFFEKRMKERLEEYLKDSHFLTSDTLRVSLFEQKNIEPYFCTMSSQETPCKKEQAYLEVSNENNCQLLRDKFCNQPEHIDLLSQLPKDWIKEKVSNFNFSNDQLLNSIQSNLKTTASNKLELVSKIVTSQISENQKISFYCTLSSKLGKKLSNEKIKELFEGIKGEGFYSNMEPTSALVEILSILLDPNILDQGDRNLCGVAVYLQYLAQEKPELLIDLSINLFNYGESNLPFEIKANKTDKEQETEFVPSILAAIRHTANFLWYSPKDPLETFMGVTLPKEIAYWISESKGEVTRESINIVDSNFEQYPKVLRKTLGRGGFYSKGHRYEENGEEKFDEILNAINQNNFCIISLSNPLTECLLEIANIATIDDKKINTMLGGQLSHYVRVVSAKKNNENICLEISTWGKTFNLTLPFEVFSRHVLGSLITTSHTELSNHMHLGSLNQN